ncbi:MAG: hypothetical protein AAF288_02600 [Planctomycetota bacterium]
MPRTYPQALRDRVLAAYDHDMKTPHIADAFLVSKAWARRVEQDFERPAESTAKLRPIHLSARLD